jgi:hypothetical protein
MRAKVARNVLLLNGSLFEGGAEHVIVTPRCSGRHATPPRWHPLARLLRDRGLRERLAATAIEGDLARFTADVMAEKYLAIYDRALEPKTAVTPVVLAGDAEAKAGRVKS